MASEKMNSPSDGEIHKFFSNLDADREERKKELRETVWVRAWCAVASAANCTSKKAPAEWADACLAEFDKRFGEKK